MCDRKAVIKNADMSEEMQQDAVDCATQALEKFNIEKVGFNHLLFCNWSLTLYFHFKLKQYTCRMENSLKIRQQFCSS